MASHNIPSFANLRDAFNSTTASQSARSNGQHPRLSQGATTTLAAGPSSASAPPRPNPVNPDGHTNAHPNLIPPGSPVTREALLAAIQSISQSKQLNVPVGTQEDDGLLVRTLYESDENGQTFRQALENLNGVHGHTATQWRDYLLDHGRRIFKLLSKYTPPAPALPNLARPRALVNTPLSQSVASDSQVNFDRHEEQLRYAPAPQATQLTASLPRTSNRGASSARPGPSRIHNRGRPVSLNLSQHRARDSSCSPPCPAKNPRPLRPHDSDDDVHRSRRKPETCELIIPPRPEHSPDPPKRVVSMRNGRNEFTDEDKKFITDFILYEVGNDPSLTKIEIQRRLEAKAPHHSALSWSLYWARHVEVEKVYNAAKNLGTTKRTMRAGLRRRNLARRSPTSDRRDTREDSSSGAESTSGDLSDWQSDPDTDADVAALGGHGDPWASADKRVMARWIAAQPADWKQHPRRDRFTGFLQKYDCKRTLESCHSMYRSNTDDMDRLVQQYRTYLERKKSKPPVKTERIEISLLSDDEQDEKDDAPDAPQTLKRKATDEDDRRAVSESTEKRRKTSSVLERKT